MRLFSITSILSCCFFFLIPAAFAQDISECKADYELARDIAIESFTTVRENTRACFSDARTEFKADLKDPDTSKRDAITLFIQVRKACLDHAKADRDAARELQKEASNLFKECVKAFAASQGEGEDEEEEEGEAEEEGQEEAKENKGKAKGKNKADKSDSDEDEDEDEDDQDESEEDDESEDDESEDEEEDNE